MLLLCNRSFISLLFFLVLLSEAPMERGGERGLAAPSDSSLCDWQVGALASKEDCPSGQYTTSGECCQQCQPGDGVVTPCGDTQTECAPCLDSE